MSKIAATEDDAITQINAALMQPGQAKLKDVATLPGAWSYDLLKLLLQKAPAVYVAFIGGPARTQMSDPAIDARFDVYAVTKQPDEETRRRGNARVIGCYDIIEIAIAQLHGHTVADGGTFKLVNVDNLFGDAMFDLGGTVYAASFKIENFAFEDNVEPATLDDFITYHAEHSVVPGPDEPDAIDNVTLDQ